MINNKLIEIDNCLSAPSFFDFLKSLNVDSALDSRDEPEFDDCWMSEFNSLDRKVFRMMILSLLIPCEKRHSNTHSG